MNPASLERTIAAVGAVLTLASLFRRSTAFTAGVAIGAAAMWVNFRWLRRIVAGALEAAARPPGAGPDGERPGRFVGPRLAVEFAVKFGALVALVYLLVRRTGVDVVGLLVGLSTVILAVVVEVLRHPQGR